MTILLTFRDNVKAYLSRYDYIFTPVMKFLLGLIILLSLNHQFGYVAILNKGIFVFAISMICAFLPIEIMTVIGGIIIVIQSMKVSIDVGLVSIAIILIFYCGYMRFFSKTGIIVLLVPLFFQWHLVYTLPILLGFLVGPTAIIPAIFGVLLYFFAENLGELVNLLAASTEEDMVQGYQYLMSGLVANKEMLLTFVVFTCVILVTYIIYRRDFEHAWIISFFVGGFLNVVLFLVGSVTLLIEVEIISIVIGSIVGIVLAIVLQFCKGVVDYQKTELLQFEDDDYYYYVKAIPKLSVAESNKNVKKINSKTHK